MIWVRRFLAVLLTLLFLPLFLAVLLLLRVNATALNPEFYIAELRQADVYNVVHDALLPAALDEVTRNPQSLPAGITPDDIAAVRDELLAAAREIAPPEWLQERAEGSIRAVGPYLLGDADSFAVTIPLQDRGEAVSRVLKRNVREGDAFPLLYDEGMGFLAEQVAPAVGDLPLGIKASQAEIEGYLRRLAPADWVQARMEQTIDELTPYLTGRADGFRIVVPLTDRVDAAGEVLKEVLAKGDTYDFVVEQVVTPAIEKSVGSSVGVVFGSSLSRAEIVAAVQQVLTREWVASLEVQAIDQAVGYLTGRSATFAVTVPLADRKQAAFQALGALLDRRLEAQFAALPTCTPQQLLNLTLQTNTLPPCRSSGISYAQAKQTLGVDLGREIARAIGGQVPDQWIFAEADLRSALGPDAARVLDDARRRIREGVTFTEADLGEALGPENSQTLDDARRRIREGITFTEADLRKAMAESDPGALEALDRVRGSLGTARRLSLLGWALLGLVLAGIGFLGGRNWGSRLAWGAVPLGIAALALLAAIVVGYGGFARPQLEDALGQATADATGVAAVALERLSLLALHAADDFVGGLRLQALLLTLVAAGALAAGVYLQVSRRRPATGVSPSSAQGGS